MTRLASILIAALLTLTACKASAQEGCSNLEMVLTDVQAQYPHSHELLTGDLARKFADAFMAQADHIPRPLVGVTAVIVITGEVNSGVIFAEGVHVCFPMAIMAKEDANALLVETRGYAI